MGGLIVGGREVTVPGVRVLNFRHDDELRLNARQRRGRRTGWIRNVVLHTTMGVDPQIVRPGAEPRVTLASANIRGTLRWLNTRYDHDQSYGSYHVLVDHDGSAFCIADLADEVTYHATAINEVSVGIGIYQQRDGVIYEAALETARRIVDAITEALGIQRQFHWPYQGPIDRAVKGENLVGVLGHRDQTGRKGPGDPGDAVFHVLKLAGYEAYDFDAGDDISAWKGRQKLLGELTGKELSLDGIPGPKTVEAMSELGYRGGLWACPPAALGALEAVRLAWRDIEASPSVFAKLAEWFGVLR